MTSRSRKKRPHKARLYLDVARNLYWDVPLSVGTQTIHVPVLTSALRGAQRGYPWACWLAEAIMAYAKKHPEEFPHSVLYAYVIASAIFLIDKISGQPAHAFKYKHNFGPYISKFDTMNRRSFLRFVNGNKELTLAIKPGRKRRIGETRIGGNGTGGGRTMTVSHGAKRRAIAAGLIPPDHGRQTVEEKYI